MIKKLIITILTCLILTQSGLAYEKSLDDYVDNLEIKLKNNWDRLQPYYYKGNYQATFEFWVDRQGKATNIQLVTSSGLNSFDYSALKAIHQAQPFDVLPADFKGNQIKIRFVFKSSVVTKNVIDRKFF